MWRALVSIALVLGPALLFGLKSMPTEMGIAVVAGAIAAGFVNINEIQSFKGAGFEAKMRKAVDEAYATTEALRGLAKPLIEATMHILTKASRWGGMDENTKHTLRCDLERLAGQMGLAADASLRQAYDDFYLYHAWDHFHAFARSVGKLETIPTDVRDQLSKLQDYSSSTFPTREQIMKVLGSHQAQLQRPQLERLEDFFHYVRHRVLRRPEALSHD